MTFLEYLKGCVDVQGHMHGLGGKKKKRKERKERKKESSQSSSGPAKVGN